MATSSLPLKRWVAVTLTLALLLGGIVLGLAVVEIGLRIAGIESKTFYTYDQHRGWAGRPYIAGWVHDEGEAYIQYNSEGFHDREHSPIKPPNTFRIALLGDSFTEARQLPQAQGIAAVIERALKTCPTLAGHDVEVMNFGVNGYGTDQELITLQEKVWNYSPDFVLLNFYPGNDLINNSRTLAEKMVSTTAMDDSSLMKPFFVNQKGDWVVDDSFVNMDIYRSQKSWWHQTYLQLQDHLRILQLIKQAKYAFPLPHQENKKPDTQLATKPAILSPVTDPEWQNFLKQTEWLVYNTATDPEWQQAWQQTEGLIRLIHNQTIVKKASFAVVTLTTPLQVNPDSSVRQRQEVSGVTDWFYPEKRLAALGEKEGFTTINLGQTFQAYAEQNNVCLHGFDNTFRCDGHWNALGHQLAGEIVAKQLCQQSIIRN
ncbi:SGNH/GDSL hydrolase family protein [Nostoc sp. FACHB-152]|uniref:SGNH/GDSL hydrolase family protein n=1 Tax=unclassified Nostoc TaxID=2593658 RepID=UPI001688CCE2|nr:MULTISPECIES: SGNH/GDSL hydrolase family protein [unclassified Nostoc]MBD2446901.1 SGNH/GDSL hydrolase family protein [Nostoc sp. FACHB-152]MBD2467762.1 SGNH/GDSL hydrolase family protein [Nostoc sp. FACHB-145]